MIPNQLDILEDTSGAVVVAKWLERRSHNLEVPSLNLPGAKASSINSRVSLIRSLESGASQLFSYNNHSFVFWGKAGLNLHRMMILKNKKNKTQRLIVGGAVAEWYKAFLSREKIISKQSQVRLQPA